MIPGEAEATEQPTHQADQTVHRILLESSKDRVVRHEEIARHEGEIRVDLIDVACRFRGDRWREEIDRVLDEAIGGRLGKVKERGPQRPVEDYIRSDLLLCGGIV